jgi:hypothetical protein
VLERFLEGRYPFKLGFERGMVRKKEGPGHE